MFNRTLESYVPKYYENIPQFDSFIYSEQQIIDLLFNTIQQIKNNDYVITADDDTLSYYENILGLITPDSTGLTDEEYRQLRITQMQIKLASQVPITFRFLVQQLKNYYGDYGTDFSIDKDFTNYNIVIKPKVQSNIDEQVEDYLIQALPANMEYSITSGNTHNSLSSKTHNELHAYTHNYLNNGGIVE